MEDMAANLVVKTVLEYQLYVRLSSSDRLPRASIVVIYQRTALEYTNRAPGLSTELVTQPYIKGEERSGLKVTARLIYIWVKYSLYTSEAVMIQDRQKTITIEY